MTEVHSKHIDSTPISSGGASFVSHTLKQISPYKLIFRPTLTSYAFGAIFIFLGTACALMFTVGGIQTGHPGAFIAVPIALAFIWIGKWFLQCLTVERSVNLQQLTVELPIKSFSFNRATEIIEFSEISALQIIQKEIQSSENDYNSFELNLILKDGSRKNIVDHAGGAQIVLEAQRLTGFIGCPLLVSAALEVGTSGSMSASVP